MRQVFERLRQYVAFTRNEQKVFFILALLFLAGAGIKMYRASRASAEPGAFDYTAQDSAFQARSRAALADTAQQGSGGARGAKAAAGTTIDLNRADRTELMKLPGIGRSMADRIIAYRSAHGAFKRAEELKKVKGIGEAKFRKLLPYIGTP